MELEMVYKARRFTFMEPRSGSGSGTGSGDNILKSCSQFPDSIFQSNFLHTVEVLLHLLYFLVRLS